MASTMFDLPDPFGPTITVMPRGNSSRVLSAKLLKPTSSSALSMRANKPGKNGQKNSDTALLSAGGTVFAWLYLTKRRSAWSDTPGRFFPVFLAKFRPTQPINLTAA